LALFAPINYDFSLFSFLFFRYRNFFLHFLIKRILDSKYLKFNYCILLCHLLIILNMAIFTHRSYLSTFQSQFGLHLQLFFCLHIFLKQLCNFISKISYKVPQLS
jgi:hypothetical protein